MHQDSLEGFSSQIKIHKVFSNQFRANGKLVKPLKTLMFILRVNPNQKHVKRTQKADQKNWNWGNSPPKLSSSPWRAEYPLCHHVARCGEWSCSSWRAKHAPCDTMLAVAGKHGSLWPCCAPRAQAYSPWRVLTVGCHEKLILHPKIPILNPPNPNLIPGFSKMFPCTKRDSKPYEIWAKTSFKSKIPIWPIFVNTHKNTPISQQISMIMITQGSNHQ